MDDRVPWRREGCVAQVVFGVLDGSFGGQQSGISRCQTDPDRSGGEIYQYLGQIHSPIVGAGTWRGVKRERR